MQSDDPDPTATCFRQRQIDEIAREVAPAILSLHVDVQQVSAQRGSRVERVRRPVEQQQPGAGNHFTVFFGKPAEIAMVGDGLGDPRFVRLSHELEDLIVAAACIHKHAAAVTSDERSVGGGRQPRLQHDEQYKT